MRETWGALLAAFQARNAADPAIRAAHTAIADDERAHAELAWRIDVMHDGQVLLASGRSGCAGIRGPMHAHPRARR